MNQDGFSMNHTRHELKKILEKARQREPLSGSDMEWILGLSEPDKVQEVFKAARELRGKYFGNRVFLYGFLYFSTYCRNSCEFCLYRKNNSAAIRYRKSPAQVIESSQCLSESGIHLIDLTMGEDPEIFEAGDQGFELLLQTIRSVKQNTTLPIMISAGVVPEAVLGKLSEAGAIWYACYQETHNRTLYQKLRTRQDYDIRIDIKRRAKERGLLIEEGLLVGVGESITDIADSIFVMRELRADQVRAMSFVPQKGTPMEHFPSPNPSNELLVIALMRLVFPECLIPASLDVGGHAELGQKLAAGANVVTSLIPPGQGLVGVAQCALDIEDGKRTVAGIQSILRENGLEPASSEEYNSWFKQRLKSNSQVSKEGNS
ncbi:MAG: methylornithine synthase PylB [Planctomycetota bacterium]|jgi:methylornithine synthase